MDEDQIFKLIQQCKHLKHKFNGVYAADNFPLKMSPNSFTIVNASPAASIGTHWLVPKDMRLQLSTLQTLWLYQFIRISIFAIT